MHGLPTDPRLFAAAATASGQEWIAELPGLVEAMCKRWGLEIAGPVLGHGYHAVVLPVRRGKDEAVLKMAWPPERTVDEARALQAWDGHGTVRLYEADTAAGTLLLERLHVDRTLESLDLHAAAAEAGRLLRTLAIPAPPDFTRLSALAATIAGSLEGRQAALGIPIPPDWLRAAQDIAQNLARHARDSLLIHADLHYGNVLASDREAWSAIDPKPVAGEPEYAVPELLWTRVDDVADERGIRQLLEMIVRSGELDEERVRQWAIVRAADYWLWGLAHGLTEDPERCRRILAALI